MTNDIMNSILKYSMEGSINSNYTEEDHHPMTRENKWKCKLFYFVNKVNRIYLINEIDTKSNFANKKLTNGVAMTLLFSLRINLSKQTINLITIIEWFRQNLMPWLNVDCHGNLHIFMSSPNQIHWIVWGCFLRNANELSYFRFSFPWRFSLLFSSSCHLLDVIMRKNRSQSQSRKVSPEKKFYRVGLQ